MITDAQRARLCPVWAWYTMILAAAAAAPALAQEGEGREMRFDASAPPAPAPALEIVPRIGASVSFTDNLYGEADAEDDVYFGLAPGVSVRAVRPRYRAYLDYQADLTKYVEHDEEDDAFHSLTHAGTAELYENYLYLDTQAYIARQLLDPSVTYTSNEPVASRNATTVASYGFSPYLLNRFGGWAESELRYGFTHVVPFDDSRASALSHGVLADIKSGARFVRTHWGLLAEGQRADYSSEDASTDRVVERTRAEADAAYDVNRHLTLLGSIGAEAFDDPTYDEEIGGAIWSAGLTVRPGPLTSLTVRYRYRYERHFWTGEAAWQPSPILRIAASHEQSVTTSQELLASTTGQLGVDDRGDLVDLADVSPAHDRLGLPSYPLNAYAFDLTENTFGLTDQAFNRRFSQLRVSWRPGRNAVEGLAFREERWSDAFDYEQTTYGASVLWGRQLTPAMRGTAEARYRFVDWDSLGREDHIYNAMLGLSYSLGANTTLYADYLATYARRGGIDDITENVVTVGLIKTF